MSRNYDNWERLVAAVLDREKLRDLARAPSLSSSFSSITSDCSFDYSFRNLSERVEDNIQQRDGFMTGSEQAPEELSHPQNDRVGSFGPEGPGIEGFQIIGEVKPGCKLLGCGYPVRGTSLCMFQWVRYYPDGMRQYIEGATNPDYIVTADDVDKLVAVECIPMDEQGRMGDLVQIFANDHNKITCGKHNGIGIGFLIFCEKVAYFFQKYNKICTPEVGPGIEGFQIIGEAKPGCKLLGCGYPVCGTSLCMFQWVRYYPDGTRQYIEGATNPDYIVTADDVDKLIAVECIPMDEQGREGDLVQIFANDHNKTTCGPGIEGFQIIGEAKPGCKLLGCGYPVRGTSLCMFQWVRYYPDGTRQYIEGAINPDYVVTADDVDKLVAVECTPMDEQGRQGDLVRIFANDHNKITFDNDMQEEINTYISSGMVTFGVQILLNSSENWEPATLSLRRSGFQITVDRRQEAVISEKYSNDLLIKIPSGLSAQFVLTCSNGASYPFSTSDDLRMRDMAVLTLRIFQSKLLFPISIN